MQLLRIHQKQILLWIFMVTGLSDNYLDTLGQFRQTHHQYVLRLISMVTGLHNNELLITQMDIGIDKLEIWENLSLCLKYDIDV